MSTTTAEITTVTVMLRRAGGEPYPAAVIAEPTETAGLYVTPHVADGHMTGYWQVTHGPSGLSIPTGDWGGVDIHTARRVADALADTDVNWTTDRDTLADALADTDVKTTVTAAIKRGKYPPPDGRWDGTGDKPVAGPAGYPNTAAQATATQLAGHYIGTALRRYADGWEIMKYDRDDEQARTIYVLHVNTMLAEYGLAAILRAFHAVDPDAADAAARDLWETYAAGDSIGEWLAEWGREHGIPIPDRGDATNVGITLPAPLSYDAVMATPLAYPEHGTVGSLRRTVARTAQLGQDRFGRFADELATQHHSGDRTPWPTSKHNAYMIAHGCSFHGWALVALLGWLAKEYPQLAVRAARMADDIGTNGGNSFCEDIDLDTDKPAAEPAGGAPATTG